MTDLSTFDQLVAAEEQRDRLGRILRATAEALRLPADLDPDAIPAAAAAHYDATHNLREQLNRINTDRQRLQAEIEGHRATAVEALDCRDVLRQQLNTHKVLVRDLHAQLANAHNALRNLAQAYADLAEIPEAQTVATVALPGVSL